MKPRCLRSRCPPRVAGDRACIVISTSISRPAIHHDSSRWALPLPPRTVLARSRSVLSRSAAELVSKQQSEGAGHDRHDEQLTHGDEGGTQIEKEALEESRRGNADAEHDQGSDGPESSESDPDGRHESRNDLDSVGRHQDERRVRELEHDGHRSSLDREEEQEDREKELP